MSHISAHNFWLRGKIEVGPFLFLSLDVLFLKGWDALFQTIWKYLASPTPFLGKIMNEQIHGYRTAILPYCYLLIYFLMTCWFKYPFYYHVRPNQLIKLIFSPLNSTSKAFSRLYSLAYAERFSLNTFGRSSIVKRSPLPHRSTVLQA